MIQTFTCDCLNVTLHGDPDDVSHEEVAYARHLIDSIPDQGRNEISQFLANSRLVRLAQGDVKTRHSYLCLKRNVANWQISYCAICDKETHAISLNGANRDAATQPHYSLALVSSLLLHEENKIEMLKTDSKYSPAFGIILPRSASYKTPADLNTHGATDSNMDNGTTMSVSNVQLEAAEKAQQFLYEQRRKMEDRIKNFALEENRVYEELCLTVQEDKNDFVRMVESVQRRRDMMAEFASFDKENNSELTSERINFKKDRSVSFYQSEESTGFNSDYSRKQKNRSADFDGLFDIDDIDVDAEVKYDNNKEEDSHLDEDEAEELDVFPLKETNHLYSNEPLDDLDEILPLSRSGINMSTESNLRTRKMASSVVQNIPYHYQSKSRHMQTPNSLPIKIPHLRSKMELESDENNFKPGESIADRIQKLARSVRNENDIFDDRPRRRLNTGDLIKSRPILN